MALPQALKARPQSLGQYNVSAPLAEGRAKIQGIQAMKQVFDATTDDIMAIQQKSQEYKSRQEELDFANGIIENTAALENEIAGYGQLWPTDKLPLSMQQGNDILEDTGNGTTVPAVRQDRLKSEVEPEYYRVNKEAFIESLGSRITDPETRRRSVDRAKAVLAQEHSAKLIQSVEDQRKEEYAKQMTAIDQAGSLESALGNIEMSFTLSDTTKKIERTKARTKFEKIGYERAIQQSLESGETEGVIAAYDSLISDTYDGNLFGRARTDMAFRLLGVSQQIDTESDLTTGVVRAETRETATSIISNYNNGELNQATLSATDNILENKSKDLTPQQHQSLITIRKNANRMQAFSLLTSPAEKERIIQAEADPTTKAHLIRQRDADARNAKERPYVRLSKITGVEPAIFPDKKMFDGGEEEFNAAISDYLVASKAEKDKATNAFGYNVPPTSKVNLGLVSNHITNGSPKTQLEFFSMLSTSHGADGSKEYLQQLKIKKPDALYLAGQVYADNDVLTADQILKGRERIVSGVISDDVLKTWRESILGEVGTVYLDMPSDREAIISAVQSVLASTPENELSGFFGSNVGDIVEDTIEKISPIADMGDYKVPVQRGKKKQFIDYMNAPSDVIAIGLWDSGQHPIVSGHLLDVNENEEQYIAKQIRNKSYTLQSIKSGEYLVLDTLEQPVPSEDGMPLIFTVPDDYVKPTKLRDYAKSLING